VVCFLQAGMYVSCRGRVHSDHSSDGGRKSVELLPLLWPGWQPLPLTRNILATVEHTK
jgi:hypothetical protein